MRLQWIPFSLTLLASGLPVHSPWLWSQQPPSTWSDAEKETFLLRAKVKKTEGVSTGVTGTQRATLSDGQFTHDASIQTIDVYKKSAPTAYGTELNFRGLLQVQHCRLPPGPAAEPSHDSRLG